MNCVVWFGCFLYFYKFYFHVSVLYLWYIFSKWFYKTRKQFFAQERKITGVLPSTRAITRVLMRGLIFAKKIRNSIDLKDQIRLCFHEKKAKILLKILLLSLFIKRVFHLFEDIICTCDSLADPTGLKPLTMESFWCLRWLFVSTIHQAWRGFKALNLRDNLTLSSATPFDNCLLTLSAYHVMNLFEINSLLIDWCKYPKAETCSWDYVER